MRASAATSRRGLEPALSLEELLQLKWALGGVLALLSVWTVFFFDLSGVALLPAATVAIAVAAWRPHWAAQIPPLVWRLAFPALVVVVAVDLVLNGEPLAAFIRLNLLLIVVRAVGPRRRREDLQLIVLCLFLVVVAGVLTVSIGFAVEILAFTAVALGCLLVITLSEAVQSADVVTADWMQVAWPRLLGRLWRATEWRVVGVAAGLFLLVVTVATVLFLAIPRFQIENSLGFLQLKNRRSLTGFSDSVRIGDVTDIAEDTTVAMRAEVSDPARSPGQPYWRLVVLDGYRDGVFRVSRGALRRASTMQAVRWVPGTRGERAAAGTPVWTCYLEAGVSRYVPLTGEFVRLRLRDPQSLTADNRSRVVELKQEPQTMFAYRVEGMSFAGRLAEPALAAELAAPPAREVAGGESVLYPHTLLEVPAGEANGRVLDRLAGEITRGERLDAETFAERAVAWLGQRHQYSMQSRLPAGAEDPLIRWLAGAAPGHCELFAGGFTFHARRAGFPVRLVTGFHGGTWNAFEGYSMIRNSDAHAWCEVFDGKGAWFRVDPTPAAGGAAAAAATVGARAAAIDRSWTARFDSLRMLWYRRIVSFDQRAQDEVFDSVKTVTRRTGQAVMERIERAAQALRAWLVQPWNLVRGAQVAGTTAGCAVLGWAAWRFRFAWWARWRRGRRGDPARRQAGRWLQRLTAAGVLEHDTALVRDLQRLRFGPFTRRSNPLAVFGRARRALRSARDE